MSTIDERNFTRNGFDFRVSIEVDYTMGEPWKEHDGHGIVSDWESRPKRPGEVIIASNRGSALFYDLQATQAIAVRDGWSIAHADGMTRRVAAAGAPA